MNDFQKWCKEILPIVQAAADGEQCQYNSRKDGSGEWFDMTKCGMFMHEMKYRIKPRTIKVNGFDVPEPMREAPKKGTEYFVAHLGASHMHGRATWNDDGIDLCYLQRGICHATKEAAIAHANAMLGIDQNKKD